MVLRFAQYYFSIISPCIYSCFLSRRKLMSEVMAGLGLSTSPFLLFTLFLLLEQVSSKIVLEEGYTVSTVFNGNNLQPHIHPYSLLPQGDSLLLLDSSRSIFYSLSFPVSEESKVNQFSGNGVPGFSDGDRVAAMFQHPRSFAIDSKGNVYVADKSNHAVRKISKSGVSTIAGGYSNRPGNVDGPAQNASFSDDFDLSFVPKICALLIADRGNGLLRQMDLKPEDCAQESRLGLGLGIPYVLVIGVLCLLVGSIIGFTGRPFIAHNILVCHDQRNRTWKQFRTSLGGQAQIVCSWKQFRTNLWGQAQIVCSGIKNAIASSAPFMLLGMITKVGISILNLMLGVHKVESQSKHAEPSGTDNTGKSQVYIDQLKDLISDVIVEDSSKRKQPIDIVDEIQGASAHCRATIDDMIEANIWQFTARTPQQNSPSEGSVVDRLGLAKRKAGEAGDGR